MDSSTDATPTTVSTLNPSAPIFFPTQNPNLHLHHHEHQHQSHNLQLNQTLIPSFHYYPPAYFYYPLPPPPPPEQPISQPYYYTQYSQPQVHDDVDDHTGTTRKPSFPKRRSFYGGERSRSGTGHGRGSGRQEGFRKEYFPAERRRRVTHWRKVARPENLPVECNGTKTTVMIRNIPNKYTREMVMAFLDNHCKLENQKEKSQTCKEDKEEPVLSAFDFLYLPFDFQSGLNKGYAFVNFTEATAVWRFQVACNNMAWQHFCSNKRLALAYGKLQGKLALVEHFERMAYPKEEYCAVQFSPARDGSDDTFVEQTTIGIFPDQNR